uniref:Immunoglobulin V-set domain-containing protein n=1 Tax=Cyprinus carpio TaxID=7962 RepID=A0A8C1U4X7_CYPCA
YDQSLCLINLRVVTVSISNVKEDSGIYWCGDHVITEVHLNVNGHKINIQFFPPSSLFYSKNYVFFFFFFLHLDTEELCLLNIKNK